MVAVLRTCLFRNRPTHWNTGTIASADGSHALFESRNLPVNYGRVQIGIAAYLSPGETRRRWSMCVLSIYRGIFSHRTRRDYGYGWDPYVDDFCIFIVGTRGFIFFFSFKRYLPTAKNSVPSVMIRWCFGQQWHFFFFFLLILWMFWKHHFRTIGIRISIENWTYTIDSKQRVLRTKYVWRVKGLQI